MVTGVQTCALPISNGQIGAQVEWSANTETNMDHYEVERSFDGVQFSKQTTISAVGNSSAAVNYNWYDASAQVGDNYYRVKAMDRTGQVKYTSVVKVVIGRGVPAISVYPNPVSGDNIGVQLRNLEKGIYTISLYDKIGQQVCSTAVQHVGGTATITIPVGSALTKGSYQLVLTGSAIVKLTATVIKN